ncbi:MAG: hypothetical protein M3Q55_09165 [Acidobacteriota bacterium]|nr:hypothetical protein [Acidobacteriota bacterium]
MRTMLMMVLVSGCSMSMIAPMVDGGPPEDAAPAADDAPPTEHHATCESLCAAGAASVLCDDGGIPPGSLCIETCENYRARAINHGCVAELQAFMDCAEVEGDACAEACEPLSSGPLASCYALPAHPSR